ncbi:hypothetical protein A2U01_0089558, partial [Trifolium medium]|nr:hypothetical protein [Trifolium medium]
MIEEEKHMIEEEKKRQEEEAAEKPRTEQEKQKGSPEKNVDPEIIESSKGKEKAYVESELPA